MGNIIFPEVSGRNLKRKKYQFPQDFPAALNLVLLAFQRNQQLEINTWLPFAGRLEAKHENLAYLEFPVIYQMGPFGQFMLNEGMRAGIPDQKARQNTITLYLDKNSFKQHLKIESEDEIQVLLITNEGNVLWHETGIFSEEKGTALMELLLGEDLLKSGIAFA